MSPGACRDVGSKTSVSGKVSPIQPHEEGSSGFGESAPYVPTSTAVVLSVVDGGRITVDVPAGWCLPDRLRRDLDALKPELLRALAPDLPPAGSWPAGWCEFFEERASAAAESGAVDPLAVAEADLRLAVWRGDVEA